MKGALRLPVAPRPHRDELLSSWMTRVAGCYGLEASTLTAFQAGQRRTFRQVDDIAPDPLHLRLWARATRVDPGRLSRLSLRFRYPDRLSTWFLERAGIPVCLDCFDADHDAGRDCYMRADWRLAEHVVCPTHGEMLAAAICGFPVRCATACCAPSAADATSISPAGWRRRRVSRPWNSARLFSTFNVRFKRLSESTMTVSCALSM